MNCQHGTREVGRRAARGHLVKQSSVFLITIGLLLGTSCACSNTTGLTPAFGDAVAAANKAVHQDFRARADAEGDLAPLAEAAAAAREALRLAKNRVRNSSDENAYLILLNCFHKDAEVYERVLLTREGAARSDTAAEIILLDYDHKQCVVEFQRWTAKSSDAVPPGSGNTCLQEARKHREFLESTLR